MRRVPAPAVAIVALALGAPSAQAATTAGDTSQEGKRVRVVTDDAGKPTNVLIGYRTQACTDPKTLSITKGRLGYDPPFDRATPRRFVDAGTDLQRTRFKGVKVSYSFKSRIAGRRVAPSTWKGTLRMEVTIRRKGEVINRCRTGLVRWKANPHATAAISLHARGRRPAIRPASAE